MENWGLVTYREQYLLLDAETNFEHVKNGIVILIAHEFSHQFFGDLVTPKWWSHIWLSEGFATLFQYIITDLVSENGKMSCKSPLKLLTVTGTSRMGCIPNIHQIQTPPGSEI